MSDEIVIASGDGEVSTGKVNEYVVTPEVSQGLARRATELIAAGVKPLEAARQVGVPEPMLRNPAVRAILARCQDAAVFTAEVQRAILRASTFQTWAELAEKGHAQLAETGETEVLMAALKYNEALRKDPEIGLTAPPVTHINLDMKPVAGLIEEASKTAPKDVFNWQIEEVTGEEEAVDAPSGASD